MIRFMGQDSLFRNTSLNTISEIAQLQNWCKQGFFPGQRTV